MYIQSPWQKPPPAVGQASVYTFKQAVGSQMRLRFWPFCSHDSHQVRSHLIPEISPLWFACFKDDNRVNIGLVWVVPQGTTCAAQHSLPASCSNWRREASFLPRNFFVRSISSINLSGLRDSSADTVSIIMPRKASFWQGSIIFFQLIWKPRVRRSETRSSRAALQASKLGPHSQKSSRYTTILWPLRLIIRATACVNRLNIAGDFREPNGSRESNIKVGVLSPGNFHDRPVKQCSESLIWTDLYADFRSRTAMNQDGWMRAKASAMVWYLQGSLLAYEFTERPSGRLMSWIKRIFPSGLGIADRALTILGGVSHWI